MKLDEPIEDTRLKPGHQCPICGDRIVTWIADQVASPEENTDELNEDGFCWVWAENVEPTGLSTGHAGNVILIDHVGPDM